MVIERPQDFQFLLFPKAPPKHHLLPSWGKVLTISEPFFKIRKLRAVVQGKALSKTSYFVGTYCSLLP
jgi:hypothetical protein